MSANSPEFVRDYANRMAPLSHRQMPVFSQVGKGLRGDNCKVELEGNGIDTKMVCHYYNQLNEQTSTLWEQPIIDLAPQLHYEMWEGVEEFDGAPMWYYYIIFKYSIVIDGESHEFWNMTTPHVYTRPFTGTTIPGESKIEEN